MRALIGFERDGREEKQATIGKGEKQTERERSLKCAETADDSPNSRRRLLPAN